MPLKYGASLRGGSHFFFIPAGPTIEKQCGRGRRDTSPAFLHWWEEWGINRGHRDALPISTSIIALKLFSTSDTPKNAKLTWELLLRILPMGNRYVKDRESSSSQRTILFKPLSPLKALTIPIINGPLSSFTQFVAQIQGSFGNGSAFGERS